MHGDQTLFIRWMSVLIKPAWRGNQTWVACKLIQMLYNWAAMQVHGCKIRRGTTHKQNNRRNNIEKGKTAKYATEEKAKHKQKWEESKTGQPKAKKHTSQHYQAEEGPDQVQDHETVHRIKQSYNRKPNQNRHFSKPKMADSAFIHTVGKARKWAGPRERRQNGPTGGRGLNQQVRKHKCKSNTLKRTFLKYIIFFLLNHYFKYF